MVVVTGTNNEHRLISNYTVAYDMTVSDSASFLKGTLLSLTDPNTASTTVAARAMLAGIATRDKVANDGHTQISVAKAYKGAGVCSGTVILGQPIVAAGVDNMIMSSPGTIVSGAQILGYALETGADQEEIEYIATLG